MLKSVRKLAITMVFLVIMLTALFSIQAYAADYATGTFYFANRDRIVDIYVNGVKVNTSTYHPTDELNGNYNTLFIGLREGKNVIAICATKETGDKRGFIGNIVTSKGTNYTTGTNHDKPYPCYINWKTIDRPYSSEWMNLGYDDSAWKSPYKDSNYNSRLPENIFPPTYIPSGGLGGEATLKAENPHWIYPSNALSMYYGNEFFYRYVFYTANEPPPMPTPTTTPVAVKPGTVKGKLTYYGVPEVSSGTIDVTKSEQPVALPMKEIGVEICQKDGSNYRVIKTLTTDSTGSFSTTDLGGVTANGGPLCIRVKAEDNYSKIRSGNATSNSPSVDTPVVFYSNDMALKTGTMDFGNMETTGQQSGYFNVLYTIRSGARFWSTNVPGYTAEKREIVIGEYATINGVQKKMNYYSPSPRYIFLQRIYCLMPSIILHEYGHNIMDQYGAMPDFSGGDHDYATYCRNSQMAYSEGWAWFFSTSALKNPLVYESKLANDDFNKFNVENLYNSGYPPISRGTRNEVANAAVMWDLADSENESYRNNYGKSDTVNLGFGTVAKNMINCKGYAQSGKQDIMTFWAALSIGPAKAFKDKAWDIFDEYGINKSSIDLNYAYIGGTNIVASDYGKVTLTSTNNDPMIMLENMGYYNTDEYRYFKLKYKITSPNVTTAFQVYIATESNPQVVSEIQQVTSANLIADGKEHIYYLDLWKNAAARSMGPVTGCRLDWATSSGVTMEISEFDFIKPADVEVSIKSNGFINSKQFQIVAENIPENAKEFLYYITCLPTGITAGLNYPAQQVRNLSIDNFGNIPGKYQVTVKLSFNDSIAIKTIGTVEANYNYSDKDLTYRYEYSQNVPGRNEHGFPIDMIENSGGVISFDAFVSADTEFSTSGNLVVATSSGISGGVTTFKAFNYNLENKGTWQHIEYTVPAGTKINKILLTPSYFKTARSTKGQIIYRNVSFRMPGSSKNLFLQPMSNEGFIINGGGQMNVCTDYISENGTYRYNYTQNMPWTYHGFDLYVDKTSSYTFSFDAFISSSDIPSTGTTMIAGLENGFGQYLSYRNDRKGYWQHFEYTGVPTSNVVRLLLYPSGSTSPATSGYVLYRNVEFKKAGSNFNLFPQPSYNGGFTVRGNGDMNIDPNYSSTENVYMIQNPQNHSLSQSHILLDTNSEYVLSFDAYMSSDSVVSASDVTLITSSSFGVFTYPASKKGTWQHFEKILKPAYENTYIRLYPFWTEFYIHGKSSVTGTIIYRNISLKKVGSNANLYPQPNGTGGFQYSINPISVYNGYSKDNETYFYNYEQNQPWTYHGYDVQVPKDREYTFSFDAYISPAAPYTGSGDILVGGFEVSSPNTTKYFSYDKLDTGKWKHFEYKTILRSSDGNPVNARLLLYPTAQTADPNAGYIIYRNVEFKETGKSLNMFPQATSNELFTVRGNGTFSRVTNIDKHGNTLRANEILYPGESLKSVNGKYYLIMQSDGNLVTYTSSWTPIWSTNTYNIPPKFAKMDTNGTFCVWAADGGMMYSTYTGNSPDAYLILENDGNLVIYSKQGTVLWRTNIAQSEYNQVF